MYLQRLSNANLSEYRIAPVTYSLVYCIVPGFLIPHRPFAVLQPLGRRVHGHPDQPQERQHLVYNLNDTAIFKLRISPLQFPVY